MKKFIFLRLYFLFAIVLVSCASAAPTSVENTPKPRPSVQIGDLVVEGHRWDGRTYPDLVIYCGDYMYDEKTPGTQTVDCEMPLTPRVQIDFGWKAKDVRILESNWKEMTWELYVDDTPIDLSAMEQWYDDTKGRGWVVDMINLQLGKHTLRLLWKSDVPIDDGFDVYPAGTYERILNITVVEKK